MEFLEGAGNEKLKQDVETVLRSIEKRLDDLKRDEDVQNRWEMIREREDHQGKLKFLECLLKSNLPLCAQFLDELLVSTLNPIQYMKYLSLRMMVTMCLDNFIKAREIARKEYEMAKYLRDDENECNLISSKCQYEVLFNSCLDNFHVCRYQGHLQEAKKYLDEAQEIAANQGTEDNMNLARVFYADWLLAKGSLNTAINDILHPLLEKELTRKTKGYLLQKLGNGCRSAALWDKAKEHLRESIKIAQEEGDDIAEYDRAADLGNVFRSEGRIADAIEMQNKHMSFAFIRGDAWGLSVACFNVGFSYYSLTPNPDINSAMMFLTVKYILTKRMDNEPLRGIALNNIGKSLCALKQYESAVKVIGECVKIARATGNIAGEGMALGNLGTAYRCLGEYQDAIGHHMQYRENANKRGDDGGVAIMERELSLDYMLKGDLENAEKYIKDAILTLEDIRVKVGQEDSSKLANFDKNQAESYNFLQVILIKRGKIKEALALSEFARGRAITDIIRRSNEKMVEEKKDSFLWSDDFILRSKLDISLTDCIIKDFYDTADKLKSSVLIYSIVTDYNFGGKAEKWLYAWIVKCNLDLKQHEERISFKRHPIETQMTKNKLITDEKFFSSLCRSFSLANAKESDLHSVASTDSKSAKSKQSSDKGEIIVKYPSGVDSYNFIGLLKEVGLVKNVPKETNQGSDVDRDASKISREGNSNTKQIEETSSEDMPRVIIHRGDWEEEGRQQLQLLYDICIGPIENLLPESRGKNSVPRLVILPHEFLFSVPFCALTGHDGKHLIEKYCISYAPSLRALMMLHIRLSTLKQKQSERRMKVLSVGNPKAAFPQLPTLVSAASEAQQVQGIFGEGNCQTLVEEEATKDKIMDFLQKVDVAHLATHAFPENPNTAQDGELSVKSGDYLMRGFIVLASSGCDCNGLLLATEIESIPKCDCQLVTLSCCETGLGKVTGDGVIGLYRAFIAAGAAGVVVTLWKIRDDVTPMFMHKFYISYKETDDVPFALRSAMLYCLKDKKLEPSQWAAFSYIGAMFPSCARN